MTAADPPLAVLIPERGRPDELAHTLAALRPACARLRPSPRVRVLVNGAPIADYAALQAAYPDCEWHFHPRPLGYHGAIVALLERSDEPWVYLLNSDMRLLPDALETLLPWRAADVFAIASQIEFVDRTRRREETGWTVPVLGSDGQVELHDREPPDLEVRGHVYAGGGSSLFQTAVLRRFLQQSSAYAPFYFEDADWGVQAWAAGLSVLYCPTSRALHVHRATIGTLLPAATVDSVIRRNLAHWRWRYGDAFGAARWHGGKLDRLGACWRHLQAEHRAARQRLLDSPAARSIRCVHHQRRPHPQRWRDLPRILIVSPFAVLPPAHGGARRIVELARASAEHLDLLLLHDEAGVVPQTATPDDPCFRAIHPVGGRPESRADWQSRFEAHAHAALQGELERLIELTQPDVLCFEHVECIGLIEGLRSTLPVVWTLHDAGRLLPAAAQARVAAALRKVSALVLSTEADRDYWSHPRTVVVENGVRLPDAAPGPSADDAPILMVAPLRYRPNLDGLRAFLASAWPRLRTRHPSLRLQVLAGDGGAAYWQAPIPAGVTLIDTQVDPAPHYADCVLAVNPQGEVEGSALKLGEALAHGRVMVSTASGARGFEALHSPALIRVATLIEMADTVSALLTDSRRRRHAEALAQAAIAPWSWTLRVDPWVDLLQQLAARR